MGRCCGRSSAGCWVPASVLLGRKRVLGNPASFWAAACAAVTRGAVQRSLDCCLRRKDTVAPSPGHPGRLATLSRRGRGVLAPLVCHSRESGNPVVSFWTAACAGRTHGAPLTRRCLRHRRPLPRWGEAYWTAACAGRTLWPPHPAVPWALPASPAVGRGVLGSCLRRNDTVPPHPAVPWAPPASPAVGRGGLDCRLRGNDTGGAGMTLGPPHPASLDGWPPSPAGGEADWVPAYAGMTLGPPHPAVPWAPPASPAVGRGGLDCRLRRDDTCWISACAGITLWPPHPAVPWAPPASPAVGRGVLDCCLRGNDTGGREGHKGADTKKPGFLLVQE